MVSSGRSEQKNSEKPALVWNNIPNNVKYERGSEPPQLVSIHVFKNNLKYFVLAEGPMAIGHYLNEFLYSNGDT